MELKEITSTIINGITGAFSKFVAVFKKNGVMTVTYIMLLFMFFYAFVLNPININEIVQSAIQKNELNIRNDKINSENKRAAADDILVPLMEDLAERSDVSRVLLFEKHNSTKNISGIDFLYMSGTYETIAPNELELEYIGDNFQRQYITNFLGSEMLGLLKYKDYLYYDHINECTHTNHRLLHKLKAFNAKSVMLIPFRNDRHQPLLILCVINNTGEMDKQSIYEHVKTFDEPIRKTLM